MNLARNLKVDSVSRLAPSPPVQVEPNVTIGEAIASMRAHRVGYVLVCQANRLTGIFTERDLTRRVLAEGKPLTLPVSTCMTAAPETIQEKDSIASAIRRMEEGGYRHLPVVNDSHQPIGVLSVKRIMHYLVEHFPTTIYNLPPDPDAIPLEREGA